jgi:uncharacterized linocin/CFP29 family protein
MNHLLRSSAPISDVGWEMLDREARERLVPALAARRLVDFSGPLGWGHSATNLIGYDSHDSDVVRLYFQQSFSFHVATPEAAVALNPQRA